MDIPELKNSFHEYFPDTPGDPEIFFAPGRINLIGEHIDYNGGKVLPCTISRGIYACVLFRDDRMINIHSLDQDHRAHIPLDRKITYDQALGWANYPMGVIDRLIRDNNSPKGFDALITSDLPEGSGLSSSAALEVLCAYCAMYPKISSDKDRVYMAQACQQAENTFVHVNCGIMDQACIALGKKDHAISLDTHTLEYRYIPVSLGQAHLVIMNSMHARKLSGSAYNTRRIECEEALNHIKTHRDIQTLCEAKCDDLVYIPDKTLKKRARHAITEQQRVYSSIEMLKRNDLAGFGHLLNASHLSLKEDFEVTGEYLDALVDEAIKVDGCLGARMTGAGFGGCAIALVQKEAIEGFKAEVTKGYREKTCKTPEFYVCTIPDGVCRLEI
ncbi:MAG: galactokinase [Thermodesulfobacteriota bacterium]|nr:galactokinase [Thermodesulfobacteriota bacterium]